MADIIAYIATFINQSLLYSVMKEVGVILLILIPLFTLWEMGRQRRSAYKPRLLCEKKYLNQKFSSSGIPCELHDQQREYTGMYSPPVTITMKNIGNSAAHSVIIEFIYNRDVLVRNLLDFVDVSNELSRDKHGNFCYSYDDEDHKWGFFIDDSKKGSIDLGFVADKGTAVFDLPSGLCNYYAILGFLRDDDRFKVFEFYHDSIRLKISYINIAEKKKTESYWIVFSMMHHDTLQKDMIGVGTINFVKKKPSHIPYVREGDFVVD